MDNKKTVSRKYKPSSVRKNEDVLDFVNVFEKKLSIDSGNGLEELQKKVKGLQISSKNERSRGVLKKAGETKRKLTGLLDKNKGSLLALQERKKTIAEENKRILKALDELEKLESKK
jgi:hypothetical protein